MAKRKYDLEDRLVDYTCNMIDLVEIIPKTRAGNYIAGQVVLKELKECRTGLKIIRKKEMINSKNELIDIYNETEELIAIIAKGIATAKNNK